MPSFLSRLALRYGAGNTPETSLSNPVIELMLDHRSVRYFRSEPLPHGTLETLIAAAQSAATSSNLQVWSVVAVENQATKAACAVIAGGQKHIEDAPLFLLFLADVARSNRVADSLSMSRAANDTFEMFLTSAIDASLASQNAVLAAESLGLSTVYIGGMRNKPEEVAQLLNLPPGAAVVFGLCVGYAEDNKGGSVKPRLAQQAVLHRETYDQARQDAAVERYNTAMGAFYLQENMKVRGNWASHSSARVAGPESLSGRHVLMQALRRMGFFKAE